MIPANGFSDKDHLDNICKILSLDDYDDEIIERLYSYTHFFGLVFSRRDYSKQQLLNEKYIVDRTMREIETIDIPNVESNKKK